MPLDALTAGAGQTDQRDARHAVGGLLAVSGTSALDVRSGVLVGPGSTQLLTGTSKTGPKMSVRIGVHVAVTSRGAANGPYLGPTLEAPIDVDVELAPASGSRIDVVYVKQRDTTSGIPTPDASPGPLYSVLTGTVSTGTPTKPNLAASGVVGAEEIGTVRVAAGATSTNGAGVTITTTARQTSTRGGVVPVRDQAERVALQTAGATYPTMQVLELDRGRLLWHDGTRFRYDGDRVTVASTTERNALTAYVGLRATDTTTGGEFLYLGGSWEPTGHKLPTIRLARSAPGSLNYLAGQFVVIPYDGVDDNHAAYNPDGLFVHKPTERRVQVTRAGLYLLQAEAIATTTARLRIGAMPNAGAALGSTVYATQGTDDVPNVSATVRLAAGDHVGVAIIATADLQDGTNGYRNGFTLTRLSA